MSKLQLKKAISELNEEQLREMILDLYSARKDAKEYFEFYINPDIRKLNEKTMTAIRKEFMRSKRGYSTARISHVKKFIAHHASFSPGEAEVLAIYEFAILEACDTARYYYLSDAQYRSFSNLLTLAIAYANKNSMFSTLMKSVKKIMEYPNNTGRMRRSLTEILMENGISPE